ncbi:MAG: glycosyltransferase family 2 protein [Miltoncostaeaceae bacterium]
MTPELSIVIPCFNGVEYTAACLASIERHTPEGHEVILVDNGSTDGTAERFAATWEGEGALIRNASNLGFGVACNQGIAAAEGRRVMVLNNDTIVTPGWFTAMETALSRDPGLGLVVPCSNHVGGPQMVDAIDYATAPSTELDAYAARRARANAGVGRRVTRVSGLCMAMTRELLDAIGGFDPVFGLGNFEDDDYSLRARIAGFGLWIADDSFIHHFGHRTFKILPDAYQRLLEENAVRFEMKWDMSLAEDRELERTAERSFDPAVHRVDLARWAPAGHPA